MTNILAFWARFLWRKWSVANMAPALCSRISFLVWLYLIHIARPDTYGCCSWLNEQKFYLTWLICTKLACILIILFSLISFVFPDKVPLEINRGRFWPNKRSQLHFFRNTVSRTNHFQNTLWFVLCVRTWNEHFCICPAYSTAFLILKCSRPDK